jgi:hypothetical protein
MNRSAGNGRQPAAGEGRTTRLAVSPGEPEPAATTLLQARHRQRCAGPAPEGSIVTRCASSRAIGRQRGGANPQHAAGRPGNPARTAEPARAQPGGAGLR